MYNVGLKKFDDELQIVYGEVYIPNLPDSDGDFMTTETIRDMAHDFMRGMSLRKIDTNHNQETIDAVVVESFLAREGDPDFIAGAWVVGVHVADVEVWKAIKDGEINGFSIDGSATSCQRDMDFDIPELVKGETTIVEDHSHGFNVRFSPEGTFLGGETIPDEHHPEPHIIKSGTITEETDGHKHNYSYADIVLNGGKT